MAFELDHLFIWTDIGAYEAERLVSFGLVEGTSNTHPGRTLGAQLSPLANKACRFLSLV
jgi:hypothetical protein